MPIKIRDIEKKCDCINKKLFFCAKEKYFSKQESNKEFTIEKYKFLHDGTCHVQSCPMGVQLFLIG